MSEVLTLLCAFVPEPPLTVQTANLNDQVVVSWADPVTNGYVIHAYKVFIQQHDNIYTQESVDCDGTDTNVVNNRECQISLETLKASPYNLVKDDQVKAKIISVNIYGDSAISSEGSGAVI